MSKKQYWKNTARPLYWNCPHCNEQLIQARHVTWRVRAVCPECHSTFTPTWEETEDELPPEIDDC
jgi:ribosomal protein S27AE